MRLNKYGITPSYAVPGELLKLGRDVYSNLNNKGVEFINHGYLSHTSYNAKDKSYLSTLFYDQLSNEMIKRDVIKGHNNFIDVFGENPTQQGLSNLATQHAFQHRLESAPHLGESRDRRAVDIRELQSMQVRVYAASRKQFQMLAGLDDPPGVDYMNHVGRLDGREPMRDYDGRAPPHQLAQRGLDSPLGLGVEQRGRLVEQ